MGGPHGNIAPESSTFVGRDEELTRIVEAFERGARCVLVRGAPGIGKTRLAREVLRRHAPPGGSSFCALGDVTSVSLLVRAVTRAVGVQSTNEGLGDLLARLSVARGRMLLVLDNAEHLDEEAARTIDAWTRGAPALDVLVTSTRDLGLAGESFELGPLSTDGGSRLFFDRMRETTGETIPESDEVRASVGRIVLALDAVPLAIELAAGATQSLGPRDLEQLLAQGGGAVLAAGPRSVMARLEASWELLGEPERRSLALASLFHGGFGALSLTQVGGTIEAVEALAKRSLVRLVPLPAGARRFDLYEPIARFAAKKLVERGEAEAAASLHMATFGALAKDRVEHAWGASSVAALDDLAIEEDNLAAAVRAWTSAPTAADATDIMFVVSGLGMLHQQRGSLATFAEIVQHAETALATHREAASALARARMDWTVATARRLTGRTDGYEAIVARALAAAESSGSRWQLAYVLIERARYALGRGAWEAMEIDLAEARRWSHELDDAAVEFFVEHILADSWMQRDDTLTAMEHSQRALSLALQTRDPQLQATAALLHGSVLAAQQRPEEAQAELVRAVAICRETRALKGEAYGYLLLGIVGLELADEASARANLEEAMRVGIGKGEVRIEAWARAYRGLLHHDQGRFAAAIVDYEAALPTLTSLREPTALPIILAAQSAAEAAVGRHALARPRLERARAAANAQGAEVLKAVVEVFGAVLDPSRARAVIARSADAAERSADVRVALRILGRVAPAVSEGDVLLLARDGSWCQPPGADRIDLRKKNLLRTLLETLATAHERDAAAVVSRDALVRTLWPDEAMSDASADNRLNVAITKLRQLGLRNVIARKGDGWQLAAHTALVRA